jgi:hypothetical protein
MPARFFWSSSASTSGRSGSAASRRTASSSSQPRPEHVGAEVAEQPGSSAVATSSSTGMPQGVRRRAVGLQHQPHLVVEGAREDLARADDLPGAVHLEVRVQREAAREAGQHVLAVGVERGDLAPGQVGRRVLGDAEVRAHDGAADELLAHPLGGLPDAVTLGHASIVPRSGVRRAVSQDEPALRPVPGAPARR